MIFLASAPDTARKCSTLNVRTHHICIPCLPAPDHPTDRQPLEVLLVHQERSGCDTWMVSLWVDADTACSMPLDCKAVGDPRICELGDASRSFSPSLHLANP